MIMTNINWIFITFFDFKNLPGCSLFIFQFLLLSLKIETLKGQEDTFWRMLNKLVPKMVGLRNYNYPLSGLPKMKKWRFNNCYILNKGIILIRIKNRIHLRTLKKWQLCK